MNDNLGAAFLNSLRLAVRRSGPGQVMIPDLLVQMKMAGFSAVTEEAIRAALPQLEQREIRDKLKHLLPPGPDVG